MRSHTFAIATLAIGLLAFTEAASAATPLAGIAVSPDTTTVVDGVVVADEDVADGLPLGPVANLAPVGVAAVDLGALHLLGGGEVLFATDISVSLPGLSVGPRDVVRVSGGVFSRELDTADILIGPGTRIDALSVNDRGEYLLSFDITVAVSGITVDDADVIATDGDAGNETLVFDASAAGVADRLDVDGVHALPNGNLLLSFDVSGSVDGISFDDEDVLEYDPGQNSWELALDASAFFASLAATDVNAIYADADGDQDLDGQSDTSDNCVLVPNGPDVMDAGGNVQLDVDGDDYGNACDGDFNQDGFIGGPDFDTFLQCFNSPVGPGGPSADPTCAESDMNGDGFVGGPDFDLFLRIFNGPPGPSGTAS